MSDVYQQQNVINFIHSARDFYEINYTKVDCTSNKYRCCVMVNVIY